ncbi:MULTISPECIES: hypothetical protein [Pseudomonas]|uniref:hypothetical protein n=1 Tax=Pseudomonas TaxID=286 RepID=UPI000EFCA954|nr:MULTISPECIES: hypothetical protein [Pseudomonas]AYO00086.1 hypothetical protein D8767_14450 [Pseudomonas sp. LTGT-11-2Z]MCE0877260.1 hypothetical protein [Pseudomonas monteilii]MCE0981846.1 hypothetical protein [Pseudomonas monteilii]MCE1015772.1 hypothetical protein [Pseudomonas monteilii]MCE1044357.1 hypothetical protein [Pseudomonas monteilii]
MRKITKKQVVGASAAVVVVVLTNKYLSHVEEQNQYAYNASVVAKLPVLPFESKELSVQEKAEAMDIYDPQNRILVTAGLAKNYQRFEFEKEYKTFLESGQEKPKDKFEANRRSTENRVAAEEAFTRYQMKFTKAPPKLMTGNTSIRFGDYDFDNHSFLVSEIGRTSGPFPAAMFRNVGNPGLVRGPGTSSFERLASATRAYSVSSRTWRVSEDIAKDIDTERFEVYAKSYFETMYSTSEGDGLMLYCIQMDLFADPAMTIPLGSQGCNSLNVTMN